MKTLRTFCLGIAGILALTAVTGRSATYTNNMQFTAFNPASRTVVVGDTVVWKNLDFATHTVTGTGSEPFCGSGFIGPSGTCQFTFNNVGTFNYVCTIHLGMAGSITVQSAVNAPPSISLTNPATGQKFIAPAAFPLIANATDSDGSIMNVQFFSNNSLLSIDTTFPFAFNVTNLAAGIYNFTARAMDNQGAMATSAVVNVHVLTNAILKPPTRLGNGQYQVTIIGIAGQTYATETSSNLTQWSAIATNVAPSSSFNVTDPGPTNFFQRYYRARQDL